MSSVDTILEAAAALPLRDRLTLLDRLWATVPEESRPALLDDPDFAAEIERRAKDDSPGVPLESLLERLKRS